MGFRGSRNFVFKDLQIESSTLNLLSVLLLLGKLLTPTMKFGFHLINTKWPHIPSKSTTTSLSLPSFLFSSSHILWTSSLSSLLRHKLFPLLTLPIHKFRNHQLRIAAAYTSTIHLKPPLITPFKITMTIPLESTVCHNHPPQCTISFKENLQSPTE